MTTKFRPMLACTARLDEIQLPTLVSIKKDGIRVIKRNGVALSRTLKPIPNHYIRKTIEALPYDNIEGEVVVKDSFNLSTRAVRSAEHPNETDFFWWVFDSLTPETSAGLRTMTINPPFPPHMRKLVGHWVDTYRALQDFYRAALSAGEEGICCRHPYALYKHGRSTINDQCLLRVKPFETIEATIVDGEPLERNENPAFVNELGLTSRSTAQEGRVTQNLLGAYIVEWNGKRFKVGTGFDADERIALWLTLATDIGRKIYVRYQVNHTEKVPTSAAFKGFV